MLRTVLRAIFWTAVTAAFIPAGFSAAPDGAFARETRELIIATDALDNSRGLTRQAGQQTREFCNEQSEACAVGQQLASFSSLVMGVVSDRAQSWAADQRAQAPLAPGALPQDAPAQSLDALLADVTRETSDLR
ncbi:hypothetical protein [Oceanicaulis alexandrii]|uniref:hypothetical protein n=1 Tax=Oceanicaulis alexandrii TaxID=153233 RepID=UPI0003B40C97|nr:hypothetical protein [Oceanicaulis alexandrii]|tara:strand:+ start:84 stop:485 length:402 start_codon:yes stop_codon:yes gene_type:complete